MEEDAVKASPGPHSIAVEASPGVLTSMGEDAEEARQTPEKDSEMGKRMTFSSSLGRFSWAQLWPFGPNVDLDSWRRAWQVTQDSSAFKDKYPLVDRFFRGSSRVIVLPWRRMNRSWWYADLSVAACITILGIYVSWIRRRRHRHHHLRHVRRPSRGGGSGGRLPTPLVVTVPPPSSTRARTWSDSFQRTMMTNTPTPTSTSFARSFFSPQASNLLSSFSEYASGRKNKNSSQLGAPSAHSVFKSGTTGWLWPFSSSTALVNDESEWDHLLMLEESHEIMGSNSHNKNQRQPPRFPYHQGPLGDTLNYETWTPPPSWAEASKRLVPETHVTWRMQRVLSLQLASRVPCLCIYQDDGPNRLNPATGGGAAAGSDVAPTRSSPAGASAAGSGPAGSTSLPKWTTKKDVFRLPVYEFGVHCLSPAEGAVMEVYVKNSTRAEWMEHTFQSAAQAAQFQVDLLATQTLGTAIYNMYQAFQIIHQGSQAHDGPELLLHDRTLVGDETTCLGSGIAWDDVMRCLGSTFPALRLHLEALWWRRLIDSEPSAAPKNARVEQKAASDQAAGSSTPADQPPPEKSYMSAADYEGKRLLLGPVDFFRLFVPLLPEWAVPKIATSRARLEQLLRWRKRVARASVLVNSYIRARQVANLGWPLPRPPPNGYLFHRLAFDENTDNRVHDSSRKQEYYEATVSRDVLCQIRGVDFYERKRWWNIGLDPPSSPTLSLYQGYTLVGMHTFQLPADENGNSMLDYTTDPVVSIPSIREMVEAHPDLHFFVHAFFPAERGIAVVQIYVRWLPRGVDPKFDKAVDNFIAGDSDLRDRKLELLVQLGVDRSALTLDKRLLLACLSFLLRVSLRDRFRASQSAMSSDRTQIPAIRIVDCGDTCHFGGSLQANEKLPSNYLAATFCMSSRRNNNIVTRILISYMALGGLRREVVDLTFVIAGCKDEELPERALGTVRLVHPDIAMHALSAKFMFPGRKNITMPGSDMAAIADNDVARLFWKVFVTDAVLALISPISRGLQTYPSLVPLVPDLAASSKIPTKNDIVTAVPTSDPIENGINDIIDVLQGVTVPLRREQLANNRLFDGTIRSPLVSSNAATVDVPILMRVSRDDIARFLKATDFNVRAAVLRIVSSCTWRGMTFPIDTRICRLELESQQFLHGGHDRDGNPVFYFRHLCLGPWRAEEDAVAAAVFHILESRLQHLAQERPNVRCTLVVLMGRPFHRRDDRGKYLDKEDSRADENSAVIEANDEARHEADDNSTEAGTISLFEASAFSQLDNPRIGRDENMYGHTNKMLVRNLIAIAMKHYPERLSKALIVVGHGNKDYARTALGGMMAVSSYITSSRTRQKIKFLTQYRELLHYIDRSELLTICGGTLSVDHARLDS